MSKTKPQNTRNNRVEVGNLNQQERDLKNHEAESVKGGGGAMGGVDYRRGGLSSLAERTTIGEEITS